MKNLSSHLPSFATLGVFLLLLMPSAFMSAQSLSWAVPPNIIKFNGAAPVISPLPGSNSNPYNSSNSACDGNGNVLFWVTNHFAGGGAIDVINGATGALVGTLNGLLYTCNNPNSMINLVGQEISIVPVPGVCKEFYIIWAYTNPDLTGQVLGYARINCTSGVTISQNSTAIQCFPGNTSGIAVSRVVNGNRYLFFTAVATGAILKRCTISSTGISAPVSIGTISQFNIGSATEMELSPSGDKILLGNLFGGSNVSQVNLSPLPVSTLISQTNYTIPGNPATRGVEFNGDGTRIFACTANGLYWADVVTTASAPMTAIASSSTYTNSQLEYARDGNIYLADNNGNLGKINPNGIPSVSSSGLGITLHSNANIIITGNLYRLPDQVDGDQYTNSTSNTSDLWMQDTPLDAGFEVNPDPGPMWVSDDIWVRNMQDGFANQISQNPVYTSPTGQNYVYVRIRENGCNASNGTEQLKVNWAKAGTSLPWPGSWNGTTFFPFTTLLTGDIIHSLPSALNYKIGSVSGTTPVTNGSSITIPVLNPGEDVIIELPWVPANPDDYNNISTEPWHFCLVARVELTPIPPFGMTFPEGPDINTNVKDNNNIIWKNLTVIHGTGNGNSNNTASVSIRNPKDITAGFNLLFQVPKEDLSNPITDHGQVTFNLDDGLYQAWVKGGQEGKGFMLDTLNPHSIVITSSDAKIQNLLLPPDENFMLGFAINYSSKNNGDTGVFRYDLVQQDAIDTSTVGGERYSIDKPDCPIPNAGVDKNICAGQAAQLIASPIVAGATYEWFNEQTGQLVDTGSAISVSPTQTTIYKLKLSSPNGCIDYDLVTVNVTSVLIDPDSVTICDGEKVTLVASGAGITSYKWSPGGKKTSMITVKPSATTSYTCTVNGGVCAAVATVSVKNAPSVTLSKMPCSGSTVVITASASSGGDPLKYQWKLNNAKITGATKAVYSAKVSGSYTIVVTDKTTGCSTTSSKISVSVDCRLAQDDTGMIPQLMLYPNPTGGATMINLSLNNSGNSEATIEVLNSVGQKVYSTNASLVNGELKKEILLDQSLTNGIYLVKIVTDESVYTSRLLYQR